MANCAACAKPLTIFNTGLGNKMKGGERLCLSCMHKLDSETFLSLKKFTASEVLPKMKERRQLSSEAQKTTDCVIEYKRTCLQCGKVWHTLASRESYLAKEKSYNDCNMCASAIGSAGGNTYSWGTWTQAKRNEHALNSEISRLKQCPSCMSGNYAEERIAYEK